MVAFNPQEQQQSDPNYLFWSRPIQDPKPNLAMEKALTGAGQAIDEAGKGGIKVAENLIAGDVRPGAEEKLDKFVTGLSASNAVFGQTGAYDVLTGGGDNKNPDDIKRMPSRVDTLMSARANGKISPSGFDAQLYSYAKEMRNKYPSFREFVDETIARATGQHPANALVRGLIQDYNQNQQNLVAGSQHLDTLAMQHMDVPGVQAAYKYYRLDPTDPGRAESLRWAVASAAGYKEGIKTNNLILENRKKEQEDVVATSIAMATRDIHKAGTLAISPLMLPLDKAETWDQWLKNQREHTEPEPDPQQVESLNMWLGLQKDSTKAKLRQDLINNYPDIPSDKLKTIINDEVDNLFNPYQEMLNNGQYGFAGHYARAVKNADEINEYQWAMSDAGKTASRMNAVAKSFGKDSAAAQAFLNGTAAKLAPTATKFVLGQMGAVINGEATVRGTLSTWISNGMGMTKPGMPGRPSPATDSQAFISFMDGFYKMLTGKNITARETAIKALYDADNKDVLNFFEHNKVDYSSGIMKPGAEALFDMFYGDKAYAAVNKQGGEKVQDFRNNAEFQGMALVNDDLKELAKQITGLPPGSLLWDSDAHGFVVQSQYEPNRFKRTQGLPVRQPEEQPLENAGTKVARPIVENMNKVFRTLESSVYAGEDPDRRIVEFLQHSDVPIANQFIDIILHHHIQLRQQEQQQAPNVNQQ